MPGISGHQVDLTRFIGSGSGADKLRIITSFPFIIFIPHPTFLIPHPFL